MIDAGGSNDNYWFFLLIIDETIGYFSNDFLTVCGQDQRNKWLIDSPHLIYYCKHGDSRSSMNQLVMCLQHSVHNNKVKREFHA